MLKDPSIRDKLIDLGKSEDPEPEEPKEQEDEKSSKRSKFNVSLYRHCVEEHELCEGEDYCLEGMMESIREKKAALLRSKKACAAQTQPATEDLVYMLEDDAFLTQLETTHLNEVFTVFCLCAYECHFYRRDTFPFHL